MSQAIEPSSLPPRWAEDISRALASAKQAIPERRLVVFLAALSTETLRLAGAESEEAGEIVVLAAICLRELLAASSASPSEDELDRWSTHAHVMLVLQSLERRGYLRVEYAENAQDSLSSEAPIRVVGSWAEALLRPQKPE